MAFSPDGKTIALTSDHQIQFINTVKAELFETIKLKPKGIYGIAFSSEGKLFAMGSADKKIRIWSIP